MRRTIFVAVILFVAMLSTTGISSACTRQPPAEPVSELAMSAAVDIIFDTAVGQGLGPLYGGEFQPRIATVSVGGTVTWNNTDVNEHTVISKDGLFNRRLVFGESFEFIFTQKGNYDYYDELYDDISGTIIVK